jgi:predicted TIM-barrel enzyme
MITMRRVLKYAAVLSAGVPILAGTDALDPFVLHGAALHQELAYLARAGFSPAECCGLRHPLLE